MKDDVERELKQMQEFSEAWERNRPSEDTGDDPDSPVPAPVKPRPLRAIGAEALPEPDETTGLEAAKKIRLVEVSDEW